MHSIINHNIESLHALCAQYRVRKLAFFGSVTDERFKTGTSDIDVLVEFHRMPPVEHADCYFGLLEALEALFNTPVDLVEPGPITNPYFRQRLEETQVVVYEAA